MADLSGGGAGMSGQDKLWQAKHIPRELILRLCRERDLPLDVTVARELPGVPYKVIRAKVMKMRELDWGVHWRWAWIVPDEQLEAWSREGEEARRQTRCERAGV